MSPQYLSKSQYEKDKIPSRFAEHQESEYTESGHESESASTPALARERPKTQYSHQENFTADHVIFHVYQLS